MLVLYVGADHWGWGGGGVKALNFNTYWGFHEKKMNLFLGGGGMKKLLLCFGANYKLGYFWGHFYTF